MGNWDDYSGVDRLMFEAEDELKERERKEREKNTLEVARRSVDKLYDAYVNGEINREKLKSELKVVSNKLANNPNSTKEDASSLLTFIKTCEKNIESRREVQMAANRKAEFDKLDDEIDRL